MRIIRKEKFTKQYAKLNSKIKDRVIDILILFWINPFDIKLNNHSLSWKYLWLRSINVTWDFRIVFKELSKWKYEIIELVQVWTHSELY